MLPTLPPLKPMSPSQFTPKQSEDELPTLPPLKPMSLKPSVKAHVAPYSQALKDTQKPCLPLSFLQKPMSPNDHAPAVKAHVLRTAALKAPVGHSFWRPM